MSKLQESIKNRRTIGWALLLSGLPIFLVSVFMQLTNPALGNSYRYIGGAAIVLMGIGIGALLSAHAMSKDPEAARKSMAEADDERARMIRGKAGSAGFITSMVLVYILLLWESFAASGQLPHITGDQLWGALAVCVLLPMLVYFGAHIINDKRY